MGKGYEITQKALLLLVDHIGNDLNRINNEVDKAAGQPERPQADHGRRDRALCGHQQGI
jgi:hypothetical protein